MRRHWPLLAVCAFFFATSVVWYLFDRRLADWDGAGHILNAFQYKQLFSHAHLTRMAWWSELLSVNCFYPPFVYFLNGLLKTISGDSLWVDIALQLFFQLIVTASVYGITILLGGNRLSASVAAVVINTFPENLAWCHTSMLDFPLEAMVGFALFALLYWERKSTVLSTIFLTAALSAAVMTKQIAAAYLLLPCLIVAWRARRRGWKPSALLLVAAVTVVCIVLPWLLVNSKAIHQYTTFSSHTLGERLNYWKILEFYLVALPVVVSPLMLITSMFFTPMCCRRTPAAWLLISSALGGIALICSLSWTLPVPRYLMPALILPAVVIGLGSDAVSRYVPRLEHKLVSTTVTALALAHFILLGFVPVPLAASILSQLKQHCLFNVTGAQHIFSQASPSLDDWGQSWTVRTIETIAPHTSDFLCIVPCSRDLNVHTFELMVRQLHSRIRPTSLRSWTQLGDELNFSEQTALYFRWFLLKTGSLGFKLKDARSTANLIALLEFVEKSGHCRLRATRMLPDGSILQLYERIQ